MLPGIPFILILAAILTLTTDVLPNVKAAAIVAGTLFLVSGIGFGLFFIPLSYCLKNVSIDGSTLIVSNCYKTVRVPISFATSIDIYDNFSLSPAKLEFSEDFGFGTRIWFIPKDHSFFKGSIICDRISKMIASKNRSKGS